jgi:hypothetical protein
MKIAVFIGGPYRFSDSVLGSLDRIIGDIEYDVFFHLWKEDLGNKKRLENENDFSFLMEHSKTKLMLLAKPYNESDYKKNIGINTNSNSSINATMGMFMSMNVLSNYLEQLPDADEYTHILRLRTDCIIYNSIENKIKNNLDKILTSNNFKVPSDWVSDHIMFAPKDKFYLFWRFKNMESIYKAYTKGKRNPERTLSYLGRKFGNKIVKAFDRGLDYHIIYTPPKATDPVCIKEAIQNNSIEYLFSNISNITENIDKEIRINELSEKQLGLKDPYSFRVKLLHKFKKLLGLK